MWVSIEDVRKRNSGIQKHNVDFFLEMSAGFYTAVIRPPPPTYIEALTYPTEIKSKVSLSNILNINEQKLRWQIPFTKVPSEAKQIIREPIYQTIPGDTVSVCFPEHYYTNIGSDIFVNPNFKYNVQKDKFGKPLIILEANSEILASSTEEMGVKTYAQLEVVAAGSEREGELMCGVRGVTGITSVSGVSGCSVDARSNGKAVLVPINGTIPQDRLLVESLLSDHGKTESLNKELRNGGSTTPNSGDNGTDKDKDQKTKSASKSKALYDDDKCTASSENTPLLQNDNAQLRLNGEQSDDTDDTLSEIDKNEPVKLEDGAEFTACTCLEFKEHVTDHSTDHVVEQIIYSEPEYSSSDISFKFNGGSPQHNAENCQKTLKRTHNGIDHTVYELSPSDSFYCSADNVQTTEKEPGSIASSDGICRIGQSSSSLTETQTSRTRHPLNRDTSVSFKKPLVVGPSATSIQGGQSSETNPKESVMIEADVDPLVTTSTKNSETSETLPAHMILEETRTYYSRKAADRGTLYCACGGITVVAIIVFLLIYFA